MKRLLLGLLLIVGVSRAIPAQLPEAGSNLQVFLLTVGPGDDISTRFGHNALMIRDTVARRDMVYNYGTYAFSDGLLKFAWNFALGQPRYWLAEDDLEGTMAEYHFQRRNVSAQELNLTPAQRIDIAQRLATNALPANAYYIYDYFRDNCSTRVRDLLDRVLGGALRRATADRLTAHGFRYHTLRSLDNQRLLMIGIDASFGAPADRPIDQWQEMFLPSKLHDRVAELRVAGPDSTTMPLVKSELPIYTPDIYHVESAPPRWIRWLPAAGVVLALLMLFGLREGKEGTAGRALATIWLLFAGLAGSLLCFFEFGSAQVFTYHNLNLFFLNPIALLLIPFVWQRRRALPSRWRETICALAMVLVAVGGGMLALGLPGHQDAVIGLTAMLPTLFAAAVAGRTALADLPGGEPPLLVG